MAWRAEGGQARPPLARTPAGARRAEVGQTGEGEGEEESERGREGEANDARARHLSARVSGRTLQAHKWREEQGTEGLV